MWSILNIKKSCRNSFNLSNWTFNQIFKFIETELGMYLHINMSIIRWYKVTVLGTVKWRTLSRKRPKPGTFKVDQLSTTIYIYIYINWLFLLVLRCFVVVVVEPYMHNGVCWEESCCAAQVIITWHGYESKSNSGFVGW